MKVLFVNLNRGYGVYMIGEVFIKLFSFLSCIDQIDVYSLQCLREAEIFEGTGYDLLITNDADLTRQDSVFHRLISQFKKYNPKSLCINIAHGTHQQNSLFDFTLELNGQTDLSTGVLDLHFVPGNIWANYNNVRDKDFIIASRILKEKIDIKVVKQLSEIYTIDVCGPIFDNDFFNELQPYINYLGELTHKELVDIYNNHKYLLVTSTTECLCLPIREALLCGCTPVVTNTKEPYLQNVKSYVLTLANLDQKTSLYNQTFNDMVLHFLFYLRGILGKQITISHEYASKIYDLHSTTNDGYSFDIIDENNLWSNL